MTYQAARHFPQSLPHRQNEAVHPAIQLADKLLIILGVFMMSGFIIFLITGNVSSESANFVEIDSPIARLSWYPLYLTIIVGVACYWRGLFRSMRQAPLLYALLLLSAASIFYSVNPDISFRRVIALFMTILFAVFLGIRPDRVQTLRYVGFAVAIMTLIHFVLIIAAPEIGVDQDQHAGAWKGFLKEKNTFGAIMTSNLIIFLSLMDLDRPRWPLWLGGVALASIGIIGSQSTTALLAGVMPIGIFALFKLSQQHRAISIVAFYFAVVAGVIFVLLTIYAPSLLLSLVGKDTTLTGRTEVWAMTMDAIERRPWTGYGYSAFWRDDYGPSYMVVEMVNWQVPSAHNAWIEQGLHLGLPGIILLGLLTIWTVIRALVLAQRHNNLFPLMLLAQLLVISTSESAVLWFHNNFHCVLFVFLVILVARRPNDYA